MSTLEDAWNEAEAELSGEPTTDGTSTEETAETTEPEVVTTEEAPTEETTTEEPVWYSDRDDDEVELPDGTKVRFADLRAGYMRQSDYTRKTTEVADARKKAEWADRFQAELRRDPLGTLQAIAEEYRLIPSGTEDFDPSEISPEAARLSEVDQKLQELHLRQIEDDIRREVTTVQGRYADFNGEEILPMIAELGSQGIGVTIEQGYFLWKGQQAVEAERRSAAAKTKAEQIAATEAAKRSASESQVGRSAVGVTTDDAARLRSMSLEEIADEVWNELESQ